MTTRLTISQFNALKKKKSSKFSNERIVVDGIPFQSIREANRYKILRLMEKAGEISELELQVDFPIWINDIKVCTYRADFVYRDSLGMKVIDDAKGFRTPLYKLKRKLVEAYYKVKILET